VTEKENHRRSTKSATPSRRQAALCSSRAHRLDPDKLRKAEAEFRELEMAGIIRRSDSPWSSLLHMVRKKDGSWRPCGDYRRLNLVTAHDRYHLPSILNLYNKLHGCKFFSFIDFVKG
jgi:hypothetical protein